LSRLESRGFKDGHAGRRSHVPRRPACSRMLSVAIARTEMLALDALVRAPAVDTRWESERELMVRAPLQRTPIGARGVTAAIREGMQRADASAKSVSKRVTKSSFLAARLAPWSLRPSSARVMQPPSLSAAIAISEKATSRDWRLAKNNSRKDQQMSQRFASRSIEET
jgi:hypothetical protein